MPTLTTILKPMVIPTVIPINTPIILITITILLKTTPIKILT